MHSVHETFGMLIIIVFFLAIPLVLTVKNIKLLAQKKPSQSPESDLITIVYGLFCTFTLTAVTSANITYKDYYEAVYPHQFHALLHSEYGIEIKMIIFLAYVGLFILVLKKPPICPLLLRRFR